VPDNGVRGRTVPVEALLEPHLHTEPHEPGDAEVARIGIVRAHRENPHRELFLHGHCAVAVEVEPFSDLRVIVVIEVTVDVCGPSGWEGVVFWRITH
jgi:hypothetical protein